ncbi:MAG: hypothetical protein ABGW49_02745 [Nitrosopumilus sp.]
MPENNKVLPLDVDSDYSIPGRFEESNSEFLEPVTSKPKNRLIVMVVISSIIISSVFFSYYFINQEKIDSQIIQNMNLNPEEILVRQYGVGEFGSAHAHAAIAVFINGDQINYGLEEYQISSKYIHFENSNPYVIHRHATNASLELLFSSFGMSIMADCIQLHSKLFCTEENQTLRFFVNGEEFNSDISQYTFDHNDKIMISLGDIKSISKHIAYVESLQIPDIPKKTAQNTGNLISI